MKKPFSVFLVFVSIITMFVACSPNPEPNANIINTPENVVNDKSLTLITNLGEDGTPQSKGIGNLKKAPDIIGVLLKFHGEGLYSSNSAFKNHYNFKKNEFDNPRAFYLEYLDTIGTNGDGMKFNYVLYVPQIIRTVYEEGNGVNPKSGNPFWWYMSTYYGEDINSIRNNWEPVLEQLLKHKVSLSLPKAEDVKGDWKADYQNIQNTTSHNDVTLYANVGIFYFEESDRDVSISPDRILYFEEGKYSQESSKGDTKKQIFMPLNLLMTYFAGSGDKTPSSLLWYFETYYHVDNETFMNAYKDGKFGELLDSCYNQYGYPEPKSSDVKQVLKTYEVKCDDVTSGYKIKNVYFYDSDILTLNGQPVYNKDRVYYSIDGEKITFYLPIGYVNQMKVVYTTNNIQKFIMNGDVLWNFVNWFCTEEEKGENFYSDGYFSAAVINKLLDYRVSTGLPEMVN